MPSAGLRQRDMKATWFLPLACALLLGLAACGQPSTGAGGPGSSADDPVTGEPSDDYQPGGGAKLVTPQRNAGSAIPGHWHKVKLVDDDTVRVFFWGGVQ